MIRPILTDEEWDRYAPAAGRSTTIDEATGGLDSGVLAMRNAERARRGRPPLVELACRYRGQVTLNGFYGAP